MISFLMLILLLNLFAIIQTSLQNEHLFTIITEFQLNNPYLIGSINDITLELVRLLSKNGHVINIKQKIEEFSFNEKVTENAIVFVNYETKNFDLPRNYYHNLLLISKDDTFEETLDIVASRCLINQKVFLLNGNSLEIYEAYTINNVVLKKKLAHVDWASNNFIWQIEVNPDFVQRRSNFQGITLKGMVNFWGLLMNADSSYLEKAPYFSKNETHQITNFTYGLYVDVLMTLQDRLNFTTILYKRKNGSFGFVNYKNGSHEGIGTIGDIFFKRIDIGVAPFAIQIERALYVDYLPPLQHGFCGIYVPFKNKESIAFETYLAPFTPFLWITLSVTGVTFATLRFLLLKVHSAEAIFGFDYIWTSFSVFWGGKPNPTPVDKKSSYKIMIMATLLCGTVIWIAYRAELNSKLAVLEKKFPFNDMESFSKTNWRMLTDSNMGAIGAAFTKAPKDSVFGKVFNNNMDRNSFSSDTKNQIALMISNSKTAMFYSHSAVVFEQEYANCQIERVWLHKWMPNGMPMTKGLPYGIFMKHVIFQMRETGQLNKLQKKWSVPEPNCSPLYKEGTPLGLEKMISLFILSIIGIFIGLFIFIIEKLCHAFKPREQQKSNKMNLQRLSLKLQKTFNNDEVLSLSTLIQDMQLHNNLLKDTTKFTKEVLAHDEENGRGIKNWKSKIPRPVRY